VDIIKDLSDHYLKVFKEGNNPELFNKGRELSEWILTCQSQNFHNELRLTSDDGV